VVEAVPTVDPFPVWAASSSTEGAVSTEAEVARVRERNEVYGDLYGTLLRAITMGDLKLLDLYGEGLALIKPAFTLTDAGVGRRHEFPVGFAVRIEAQEWQLARLREHRWYGEPDEAVWFETRANEVLGPTLGLALAFLGMPKLTTGWRDTQSAWAVRTTLLGHPEPRHGLQELQGRISARAIVHRELRACVEGFIGSPVDPLGPRHAFLVACLASGEHEKTEEATRVEWR
jgi:hypothetical protein